MLNAMWHVLLGAVNWGGGLAEGTVIYKIKYSTARNFHQLTLPMAKWIRLNQNKCYNATLKKKPLMRISNSSAPIHATLSCFLPSKTKLGWETFLRKSLVGSLLVLGYAEEKNGQMWVWVEWGKDRQSNEIYISLCYSTEHFRKVKWVIFEIILCFH